MGVLEKLLISLGFGFCEWCQKSWYLWLGTKKNQVLFCKGFSFTISSLNSFNKLDSSTWLYMNIHVEKTFKALQCQICGKYFQKNWQLFNTCKKSTKFFLVHCRRYQDFWHILLNPKLLILSVFSSPSITA